MRGSGLWPRREEPRGYLSPDPPGDLGHVAHISVLLTTNVYKPANTSGTRQPRTCRTAFRRPPRLGRRVKGMRAGQTSVPTPFQSYVLCREALRCETRGPGVGLRLLSRKPLQSRTSTCNKTVEQTHPSVEPRSAPARHRPQDVVNPGIRTVSLQRGALVCPACDTARACTDSSLGTGKGQDTRR